MHDKGKDELLLYHTQSFKAAQYLKQVLKVCFMIKNTALIKLCTAYHIVLLDGV